MTNPRSNKTLFLLAIVFSAITGLAVIRVWTHLQVIDYSYRISNATRSNRDLQEQNQKLKIELALLKRPDRIMHIAEQELGLEPSKPSQLRHLRSPAKEDPGQLKATNEGTHILLSAVVGARE